jgi:hypothetical protein
MEQKKKNLLEMRKLGFSQKTLSLLNESQISMILEKIKKKETKEAETTTTTTVKKVPADEPLKLTPQQLTQAQKDKTATTLPDGSMEFKTVKTEVGEGKKKKKKYNPWAVCTSSVGRKNKKKYEDCVMGVKKKLKEGRNPYEYLIESKMEEIVENNLSPKMTKGEIMSIIAEKKMMMKKPIGTMIGGEMGEGDTKTAPVKTPSRTTEKEPGKRKPNPGKNPGVSPAPKASYMEGDTKTAPTKTPTKTEPARRTANPGKKTGPQENPKPKAGKSDSEMESKKNEIINAIFNLIDKESK